MKKIFMTDVLLLLSGIICIFTGILMDFHAIPGGKVAKGMYKAVHTYSGYIMAAGLCVHIFFNKERLAVVVKKILRRDVRR